MTYSLLIIRKSITSLLVSFSSIYHYCRFTNDKECDVSTYLEFLSCSTDRQIEDNSFFKNL